MNSCGGLTPPHEVGAQSDGVTPGLPAVMIVISKSLSQTRETKERCIFRLEQRLRYYGQLAPPPLAPTPTSVKKWVILAKDFERPIYNAEIGQLPIQPNSRSLMINNELLVCLLLVFLLTPTIHGKSVHTYKHHHCIKTP